MCVETCEVVGYRLNLASLGTSCSVKHMKDHDMAAAAHEPRRKPDEGIWDTVKVIIQALLIAFAVRMFFYQPFNIPSGSMYPTLKVGDYLFVSKLSYGYSKYSFNFGLSFCGRQLFKFGPLPIEGRFFLALRPSAAMSRFSNCRATMRPTTSSGSSACPATASRCATACSIINGQPVKKNAIADLRRPDGEALRRGRQIPQYVETLPNGVSYSCSIAEPNGPVTIPTYMWCRPGIIS